MLFVIALVDGAFYLPGIAPTDYQGGDEVLVSVNKLNSVKTQLPFDYYRFNFCSPSEVKNKNENLGEVLAGEKIETSPYEFVLGKNEYCKILCRTENTEKDMRAFAELISRDYRAEWIVDNLPVGMRMYDSDPTNYRYERGMPLGYIVDDDEADDSAEDPDQESKKKKKRRRPSKNAKHYIFNHVRFRVLVHSDAELYEGSRIVGFEVEPVSVSHELADAGAVWQGPSSKLATCNPSRAVDSTMAPQDVDSEGSIVFTYDVEWIKSDIEWSNRWDLYLRSDPNAQIHWFSILNSTLIVFFLTGMVAMIMMRTLHKDINAYNMHYEAMMGGSLTEEEAQEETGWKLLHADVFRPPQRGKVLLSIFVGTGTQIIAVLFSGVVFALAGFLSPANRGGLVTAVVLLFIFMGSLGGFVSARIYKMLTGTLWRRNTALTAISFPAVIAGTAFFINLFVWAEHSTRAIPITTMLALVFLWIGISVPLVCLGSYFGYKRDKIENPTVYNDYGMERTIPEQSWYVNPVILMLVGGSLPFGAVFIELFFILSAVWLHKIYYLFGFLFLVLIILTVTCAEISVVLCYFKLINEDYRWWWQSILTSGASALYVYLYAIVYFFTKLDMTKFTSALIYFGYMGLASVTFFLLTGTIGFFACFWFLRLIYGSIKVE
jgi:transmembrane 9 superfamily protein 2/4